MGKGKQQRHYSDYFPRQLRAFFETVGGIARFTGTFFAEGFKRPFEWEEVLHQSVKLGYNTLALVSITGFIMGLVFTLQILPTMTDFGAKAMIPPMVSIAIIREIGPMITAVIFAGKVGSGIGAEIASMKVTEQIDAMAVSGSDPFRYLVVTRTLACMLTLPLLVFYVDFVALIGSIVGLSMSAEITWQLYFSQALGAIEFADIVPATLKCFFFGFAVGIVGCYKGYKAEKGTVGVGWAANSAVVTSSLIVFIIDLIVVQLTQFFI